MVLFLITPPTMLFSLISYSLSNLQGEEVVLFANEPMFKSKGAITFTNNLVKAGVLKDVVYCQTLYADPYPSKTVEEYEERFKKYFDDLFSNSKYSLSDFDKIFCINDNWDGNFNLYLNLKKYRIIGFKSIRIIFLTILHLNSSHF